jgi:hypothetical protein
LSWLGAIISAVFAILAFRNQSSGVGLLQKQVEDEQEERGREAEERRKAQAARVYMTREIVGLLERGGLEQEVRHDVQRLVEEFREWVGTEGPVEVQGCPPCRGLVSRE